ncbi:prepilin-type N-terminal cleavage/methylation domain-containing protein [Arcobacter sp. LA11]|uniref:prepilin-type N-terminal cleavage/methylation domain-containing protein n=1 Tax=Arcobacter sp. LA11 TaxID=1898176 RepID=UPI000932198A|nr:prepilin-type N-terminal cleavage/methylation domain-containing protein [Arcobacter sp. LA11]
MKKSNLSNINCKKAFSLLELIIVLFISSIVITYTFIFTKELYETQTYNQEIAILKIDLNSTKIIIERNLPSIISSLKYENKILFLKDSILLKNVSSFKMKKTSNILQVDITLEDKISQIWKFKL